MRRWNKMANRWTWSTSTDTSGIHVQTQKYMQNTSWELTGVPDQRKRIYRTMQNLVKGTRGKNSPLFFQRFSSTGPALGGRGNWSKGPIPTLGQLSESEEKHLRLRVKQLICGSLNGMRIKESLVQPYISQTDMEGTVAGSWSLPTVEQSLGKGCCWLRRDGSMRCEGGDCGGKCLWRKAGQPWKQDDTAESCWGDGANTIDSLPQHASTGSWAIERLTHQTPDAQNYRVGPHPGCPFKCLMCWSTE